MAKLQPPPEVVWAERNDLLYVTIRLTDIHDHKLDVTEDKLTFRGTGGTDDVRYYCELEFYKPVNPQESKQRLTQREIFLKLKKQESGPYWNCLVKGKRPHFLHTDFNHWRDEDESDADGDEEPELDNLMSQMGGLGDQQKELAADVDSDDSDDEDLPDLESKPPEEPVTANGETVGMEDDSNATD